MKRPRLDPKYLAPKLSRPDSLSRSLPELFIGLTWILPTYELTEFDEKYSDCSVQSRIDQCNNHPHPDILGGGSVKCIYVPRGQV
jgi:hypothetical protein